jgi:hypothetical protein
MMIDFALEAERNDGLSPTRQFIDHAGYAFDPS